MVPVEALQDERLTGAEFKMLACLLSFRNEKTGLMCPGIDKIAARLGLKDSTSVSRTTKKLVSKGWLKKSKPRFDSSIHYELTIPDLFAEKEQRQIGEESQIGETCQNDQKDQVGLNGQVGPDSQDQVGLNGQDELGQTGQHNNEVLTNKNNNEVLNSCTEQISAPTVARLPLVDGSQFSVTQDHIDQWAVAYPATEPLTEVRQAIAWCNANPKKRKTRNGAMKFLNGWLSRSQNSGGTRSINHTAISGNRSSRSTRDVPLSEQITDTSWAYQG